MDMMKRMLSTSRVPLLVLLLSGCASPWKSAEGDVAMQIPPSVRAKVDSMEGAPGRGRLLSIRRRVDDVATGNFGMHFFSNSELNFGVQERALKVAEVRRWAPPDAPTTGALVANVSSICGLIDILREEQDAVRGSIDLAVGGAVITQSSTAAMIRRSRLNDIESSSSICSPVAGASFTYRVVHAMQRNWVGPKINQLATIDRKFQCAVGADARKAAEVAPNLRGDYLEVKCTGVSVDGDQETASYAFLIDSGIYLWLGATDAAGTRKYTYLEPTYNP